MANPWAYMPRGKGQGGIPYKGGAGAVQNTKQASSSLIPSFTLAANGEATPESIASRRDAWANTLQGAQDVYTPNPLTAGAKALTMGLSGWQQGQANRQMDAGRQAYNDRLAKMLQTGKLDPVVLSDSFGTPEGRRMGMEMWNREHPAPPSPEEQLRMKIAQAEADRAAKKFGWEEQDRNKPKVAEWTDKEGNRWTQTEGQAPVMSWDAPSDPSQNYFDYKLSDGQVIKLDKTTPQGQAVWNQLYAQTAEGAPRPPDYKDFKLPNGKSVTLDANNEEQMTQYQQMIAGQDLQNADTSEPLKETDLSGARQDFDRQTPVKNYTAAIDQYNSMLSSVQNPSPVSDLGMIIALAKIWDPTSVVRTQEGEQIQNTGSLPDWLTALYTEKVKGGGMLSDKQRMDLMSAAQMRVAAHKATVDDLAAQQEQRYAGRATRNQVLNEVRPLYAKPGTGRFGQADQFMRVPTDPRYRAPEEPKAAPQAVTPQQQATEPAASQVPPQAAPAPQEAAPQPQEQGGALSMPPGYAGHADHPTWSEQFRQALPTWKTVPPEIPQPEGLGIPDPLWQRLQKNPDIIDRIMKDPGYARRAFPEWFQNENSPLRWR
jgi:hypothetical protein